MKKKIFMGYFCFVIILLTCSYVSAQDKAGEEDVSGGYQAYPVIFEAKQRAILSAERAGVLTLLNVDVGSRVKKGAVIAKVDPGELGLRKKRAELALRHLNVQVKDLSNLKKRGLATNDDVAKAIMERDVTRTDIDIIKKQISKSYIRAPYACVVVRRLAQPHEWVTAGQPVVEIVSLNEIRAVANIPADLAVKMKKGDKNTFYVHDIDGEVSGVIFAVAPEVDERSNTAQIIWAVKKGDKNLLPGMKGEVRVGQ